MLLTLSLSILGYASYTPAIAALTSVEVEHIINHNSEKSEHVTGARHLSTL